MSQKLKRLKMNKHFLKACIRGSRPEIETAVKRGVDINEKDKFGMTPLMFAAWGNPDPEVVSFLLNFGANVNAQDNQGKTALMWATGNNPDTKIIIVLLQNNADVSITNKNNQTAIDYARENQMLKNTEVLKHLRETLAAARPGGVER